MYVTPTLARYEATSAQPMRLHFNLVSRERLREAGPAFSQNAPANATGAVGKVEAQWHGSHDPLRPDTLPEAASETLINVKLRRNFFRLR